MLYVSERGEARVVRMAVVGNKRSLLESAPRR